MYVCMHVCIYLFIYNLYFVLYIIYFLSGLLGNVSRHERQTWGHFVKKCPLFKIQSFPISDDSLFFQIQLNKIIKQTLFVLNTYIHTYIHIYIQDGRTHCTSILCLLAKL